MKEVTKSIWIDAPPDVVFSYFTDAEKVARWSGRRVEIDPVPGGVCGGARGAPSLRLPRPRSGS